MRPSHVSRALPRARHAKVASHSARPATKHSPKAFSLEMNALSNVLFTYRSRTKASALSVIRTAKPVIVATLQISARHVMETRTWTFSLTHALRYVLLISRWLTRLVCRQWEPCVLATCATRIASHALITTLKFALSVELG